MADDAAQQEAPAAPNPGEQTAGIFQRTEPATGEDALGDPGKKALDAERAARSQAEQAAKTLQRELEQIRTANLSETERAIAEAERRGEANALGRVGQRLVDAELRLATAGRSLTTEALLTFDRSQFLMDDGDVNREALTKWVEAHSITTAPARFGDVDQGVRDTPPPANSDARRVAGALFGTP